MVAEDGLSGGRDRQRLAVVDAFDLRSGRGDAGVQAVVVLLVLRKKHDAVACALVRDLFPVRGADQPERLGHRREGKLDGDLLGQEQQREDGSEHYLLCSASWWRRRMSSPKLLAGSCQTQWTWVAPFWTLSYSIPQDRPWTR